MWTHTGGNKAMACSGRGGWYFWVYTLVLGFWETVGNEYLVGGSGQVSLCSQVLLLLPRRPSHAGAGMRHTAKQCESGGPLRVDDE